MNTDRQEEFRATAFAHTSALFNLAFRLCGQSPDAEELVREALLHAYHSYPHVDPRMPPRNWLFAVLHDTWQGKLHNRKDDQMEGEFEEIESISEAAHTEMEAAISTFDMERLAQVIDDRLRASLQRLPECFREVLLLSTLEGFSYGEIAEITGAPAGTVMSRLYRARRLLKQDLWQHAKALGFVKDRKHGL
ncbi:MAG: sigma-70 family RNA polymerase sigma factor [Planctomycetes bacterium]|nr:sigma-70 family RNA polymerase sigma factor [Planctomycetota bacterium]